MPLRVNIGRASDADNFKNGLLSYFSNEVTATVEDRSEGNTSVVINTKAGARNDIEDRIKTYINGHGGYAVSGSL